MKNSFNITAPFVGTFYRFPRFESETAEDLIHPGDNLVEDSVIGFIFYADVYTYILAECRGTVREVIVKNGQIVYVGDILYVVDLTTNSMGQL